LIIYNQLKWRIWSCFTLGQRACKAL